MKVLYQHLIRESLNFTTSHEKFHCFSELTSLIFVLPEGMMKVSRWSYHLAGAAAGWGGAGRAAAGSRGARAGSRGAAAGVSRSVDMARVAAGGTGASLFWRQRGADTCQEVRDGFRTTAQMWYISAVQNVTRVTRLYGDTCLVCTRFPVRFVPNCITVTLCYTNPRLVLIL